MSKHLEFQRMPQANMTPYTKGFYAGRRWAFNEVREFLVQMAEGLDKENPESAAVIRSCWVGLEKKL